MTDPSEGRERARQELPYVEFIAMDNRNHPAWEVISEHRHVGPYYQTERDAHKAAIELAYDLGRRSLEQERDELRTALQHAHLYFLQSNKLTVDDREMLDEMWAALHKGDS